MRLGVLRAAGNEASRRLERLAGVALSKEFLAVEGRRRPSEEALEEGLPGRLGQLLGRRVEGAHHVGQVLRKVGADGELGQLARRAQVHAVAVGAEGQRAGDARVT